MEENHVLVGRYGHEELLIVNTANNRAGEDVCRSERRSPNSLQNNNRGQRLADPAMTIAEINRMA